MKYLLIAIILLSCQSKQDKELELLKKETEALRQEWKVFERKAYEYIDSVRYHDSLYGKIIDFK